MTLQSLIGKPVVAGDGGRIGRIFSFRGERRGGNILVTHFRVGLGAWMERLWPSGGLRHLFARHPPLEVPWEAIASVDRDVRLKPEWTEARCRESVQQPDPQSL